MVQGLGYGSAAQDKRVGKNNDATGGNNILRGQCIDIVIDSLGTEPNTAGPHIFLSRSGANSLKVVGVAAEDIDKGPGVATGEGQFGEFFDGGLCQVRPEADALSAGDAIGPDANGDWTNDATADVAEYAVLLEASGAANQDLKWAYFSPSGTASGFGGA